MKKSNVATSLITMLKGALIGAGAILPGISGGVLCVAMGIYGAVMRLLEHPFREIRKGWKFFLPLALGFLLGVLGLSKVVAWLFSASQVPAVWLFIGLIAGTLPALWRESGKQGRGKGELIACAVAFALMLAFLLRIQSSETMQLTGSFWLWALCGVLWGVGLIAPGMSPSSLFIFMGVYQPMSEGIGALDFSILLPMGLGLLACVLSLSRGINWLLKKHYGKTMHVLLGVSLASTAVILPFGSAQGWQDVLLYVFCFAAGLVVALWMDKISVKMEAEGKK